MSYETSIFVIISSTLQLLGTLSTSAQHGAGAAPTPQRPADTAPLRRCPGGGHRPSPAASSTDAAHHGGKPWRGWNLGIFRISNWIWIGSNWMIWCT